MKELLQAVALADRLLDAPDVRHLHAHFAHGTTTITWLAAEIVGLPFSFTGHARDIYAEELNPAACCAGSCRPRASRSPARRRTAPPEGIAPGATVHLVYHGLGTDFARLADSQPPFTASPNGRLRVLGVGRLVAKKGFDLLVEACALLADRRVPFEALIVGQDDKHGEEGRDGSPRSGSSGRSACPVRWARPS